MNKYEMEAQRNYDSKYRQAEAMYHKDYTYVEIARSLNVSRTEALDLMEKIFHREQIRKARERRA